MKKFLKTTSCLLLAMLMAFAAACNGDDSAQGSSGGSSSSESAPSENGGNEGGNEGENAPLAQYTIDETVQKLTSSVYADSTLTDDETYGLKDISNVGVVEENMSAELYPIDDTDCTVIEYDSYSSASTGYQKLLDAFNYAKELNAQGKKAIISLPENGVIEINSAESSHGVYTYAMDGFNGLYVQGNGCKILLDYEGMAFHGFIYLSASKDVYFNDLTVDYKVPTTLNGTISNVDLTNRTVTVDVDPEFNALVERLRAYANTNGGRNWPLQSYVEFDAITRAPKQGGNFLTQESITGYAIMDKAGGGYQIMAQFVESYQEMMTDAALGDLANLGYSVYSYDGFDFAGCENVYMENVALYTCPGMGVVGTQTKNIYINRLQVAIPEGSNRLMTTTADGTHFGECYGEVKITNSVIENSHDDALNIKSGYYYNLDSVNVQTKTITVSRRTSAISMPEVGNVFEFYKAETFEYMGKGTITEITGDGFTYTMKVKESLLGQDAMNWGSGVVATNVSKSAKLTFTNNIVRNKRNRGLLVQVRDAVIANNAFQNVGHGSISVHSALDQFNEATIPNNIVIENNKFINNNYLLSLKGDIHVFALSGSSQVGPAGIIKDVTIRNNLIARNGNAGISLQSSTRSSIEDNLFYNNSRVNVGEMYDCAIELNNAGTAEEKITIKGNYAYNTLDSATYAGIITAGMTAKENVVLEENINVNYQVIEAVVATVEVAKLGSAVTVDGDLSDWATQGTVVDMIGATLADGKSMDVSEYSSYFGVETCKIAWNDDGLYIAFEVRDDKLHYETVNNFWLGDCFEMFLSTDLSMANADMQLYKNDGGDVAQIAMTPSWKNKWTTADVRTSDHIIAGKASVQASCIETETGYKGELFLPFSVFTATKTAVDNGEEVAIAMIFGDSIREDVGRKRLQVANVPHNVENWKTKTGKTTKYVFVSSEA